MSYDATYPNVERNNYEILDLRWQSHTDRKAGTKRIIVMNLSTWDRIDFKRAYVIRTDSSIEDIDVIDALTDAHKQLYRNRSSNWYKDHGICFGSLVRYVCDTMGWTYSSMRQHIVRLTVVLKNKKTKVSEYVIHTEEDISSKELSRIIQDAHTQNCDRNVTGCYAQWGHNPEALVTWLCEKRGWLYEDEKDVNLVLEYERS